MQALLKLEYIFFVEKVLPRTHTFNIA